MQMEKLVRSLGYEIAALKARVARLEVNKPKPRHSWTTEEKEEVADMLRRGLTCGQIAGKFNVSPHAIAGLKRATPSLRAIGFQSEFAKRYRERAAA